MSKQSQHVLIALPHPLLHLVSLGLVSFIFTLFSLELSQFGTQLAPLWFPTSIMMVAFYRHAGRMWPGIALSCSLGNIAASILLFSTSSLNMTWTTINIVEAVVGAVLLRTWDLRAPAPTPSHLRATVAIKGSFRGAEF